MKTSIQSDKNECFIPNLCSLRAVFIVVVIAQLFAFLVVLVPQTGAHQARWADLGLISMYVQWSALSSCYVLCAVRPLLSRYSARVVAVTSYLIVLLVVFAISELAYWFVYPGAPQRLSHLMFVSHTLLITFILTGPILRYFYIQHQWKQQVYSEAEARLQSLQSRIRPHFFFNSLNTIASLTRTDAIKAEAAVHDLAIEDLADLFRASLSDALKFHSFRDELNLCERYLDIERLRLGDRLKINWDIESIPKDSYVPPLLIQPLLENAIYHGIEPRKDGGLINISGDKDKGMIRLIIQNPVPQNIDKANKGNQIAQQNIRDRLQTLFPGKGDLIVFAEQDNYLVTLSWPYRNEHDEDISH